MHPDTFRYLTLDIVLSKHCFLSEVFEIDDANLSFVNGTLTKINDILLLPDSDWFMTLHE